MAQNQHAYLRVLERVYVFLIKFVRHNLDNQLLLMEHIDAFLDDIEYGVHSVELISEIFKDNPKLKSYNIVPIVKKICSIIDETPLEVSKKSVFLSFLPYYMKCGEYYLKENQTLILNEMTNSSRKSTIYLFSQKDSLGNLPMYLEEMKKHYVAFMMSSKLVPEIEIPPELTYTIEFIKMMAMAGEGLNAQTEVKAQSLFSVK